MAAFQPVQSFYSPVSAGSMAHVGAVPQGNASYNVVNYRPRATPIVSPGGIQGVSTVTRTSPMPQPVTGPKGYLPVALNNILTHPIAVGTPAKPANWFNHPNL